MKLGEEALENVKMGTNEITGDISVSEKKALVLSVPYSKGFTGLCGRERNEASEGEYHVYGSGTGTWFT